MSSASLDRAATVRFFQGLPSETKGQIVYSLLADLASTHGPGPIPVTSPSGEPFGYFLPPQAAAEEFRRFADTIPESIRDRLTAPLPPGFDIDDCLTDEELTALNSAVDSSTP